MLNQFKRIIYLLFLFCIVLLSLSSCQSINPSNKAPIVKKGIIDLRDWNFQKQGIVDLRGQWEFYWQEHISYDEFIGKKHSSLQDYIEVPGVWNNFEHNGEKLPGSGFATYRTKVLLGRHNKALGLKLLDMSSAFSLYLDDKLLTSTGFPGKTAEQTIPFYSPKVVTFENNAGEFDIIVHVSNFNHRNGGIWLPVLIGTPEQLNLLREKKLVSSFFLFGTICIIGFYHLGLFCLRRKDRSTFYFSIVCIMICLRIATHGERYIVAFFPDIEYWLLVKFIYLSFYICVPFFGMYAHSLFPNEISRKIVNLVIIVSSACSLAVLFLPASFYTKTLPSYQVLTLLFFLYGMYGLIRAIVHKRQGSLIFLAGFLFLLIAAANDILFARMIISTGYFVQYGLFVLILSQAFLISQRFSQAFIIAEEQGIKLKNEISERHHIEQSLKQSEENYRLLIENQTDLVVKADLDGRFQFVSPSYCEMFDSSDQDLIGSTFMQLVHPDDKASMLKGMEELSRPPHTSYIEQRAMTKDGWRWLAWMCTAIFDENNNVISLIGNGRDITEKKEFESALKSSQETFLSVLDGINATVYVSDLNSYEILFMNRYMREIFHGNLIGETCHKVFRNSSTPCPECTNSKLLDEKGEPTGVHIWNNENPITKRWYINQDRAIKWQDGRYVRLQIATDITDLRNMENELRQTHKMESIGTLAGGIAHDFNNLLYMIMGNTELLAEHMPEDNPGYANIEEIKSAGIRASGVVKQLLHFSRKTDQQLEPINIVKVVKEALEFLRSAIPSNIEIRKQLPDKEIMVRGDAIQINQIMMNLCINSSQAMQENNGVLGILMEEISLDKNPAEEYNQLAPGNYIKIKISDTGKGIPKDIQDRIFDPYFTTKDVGEGSGMGLSVVHGLVNNHDGLIFFDSDPGEGAAFNILFPIIYEHPVKPVEEVSEIPRGQERVLFVDDEKSIVDMVGQLLQRLGYDVKAMQDPSEAFDLFKENPEKFDLIITDMTMPQMTGARFAEKLKKVRADIPVIICTGHSSLMDENKARDLGIEGYIMKPVSLIKIAKTIREVLG